VTDFYQVTLTDVDNGGSQVLPVGTIFPSTAAPVFDEKTGELTKSNEGYALEGIFQEGTREDNFNAFFDLFDFSKDSGRIRVEIKFGASTIRTIEEHSTGPHIRACRLVQRPGALSTHAHFIVEIDSTSDDEIETNGKKASNPARIRRDQFYADRYQATTITVRAEGKEAKEFVLALKPTTEFGPLTEDRVEQVDERTWEASWSFEVPHENGRYLTWERTIEVQEGGRPLEEIPIMGEGPIIREGLRRAYQITDTNKFTTLGEWKEGVQKFWSPPALNAFRDPTRSNDVTPWQLRQPAAKNIWERTWRDFFIVADAEDILDLQARADAVPVPVINPIPDPTGFRPPEL